MKSLLALLAMLPALAAAALPDLSPLKASYRITVNGVPAGTAATVEVRPVAGNRHEVAFRVQNRFFHHEEVSGFEWNGCRVKPLEYRHEFTGMGIERDTALLFDWPRHIAIETRGTKLREIPLTDDIADSLNMAMVARCRLREHATRLDFPIIYRGERKELHFAVTGREVIETAVGRFDTLVIERLYENGRFRRTRLWVAPDLDWFMVRFEHVENPAARGSLLLTEFVRDGVRDGVLDGKPPALPPSTGNRKAP